MQRRKRVFLFLAALLVGMGFASSATAERLSIDQRLPVQLALGDSWANGFRASAPAEGYVPQLHQALLQDYDCPVPGQPQEEADGCPQLQLVNLAKDGATVEEREPSLVHGQFPQALPLLESHNGDGNPFNDVEAITVHIGGNDVTGPIINACIFGMGNCLTTIQGELAQVRIDLEAAMETLRDAVGDGTLVLGTYDNPIEDPDCALFSPFGIQLADLVLEGGDFFDGTPIPEGLNDIIRSVAPAPRGVPAVADVFRVFDDENRVSDDENDWFGDCTHPNDFGYDKVTAAFLRALGLS
jgi:hypothetical protein